MKDASILFNNEIKILTRNLMKNTVNIKKVYVKNNLTKSFKEILLKCKNK